MKDVSVEQGFIVISIHNNTLLSLTIHNNTLLSLSNKRYHQLHKIGNMAGFTGASPLNLRFT